MRSIRAFPGGSAIKAIALTGFIREEDRQRALTACYDHFAVKPVDLDRLFALIWPRLTLGEIASIARKPLKVFGKFNSCCREKRQAMAQPRHHKQPKPER